MRRKPLWEFSLDRESPVSLQEQLTMDLKRRIQAGSMAAGEKLPSSRDLAQELRVSRNTVIAVLDRLAGEGYLEARMRSGFFVCAELTRATQSPVQPRGPANCVDLQSPVQPELSAGPRPLRPCQPDVRLFPLAVWNRLRARVLRTQRTALLHYQSQCALGLPSLRQALAEYLNESRGVRCSWTQVAITTGSQQAIYLLSQLLLKPGDRVFLEDPGYSGARLAFARSGAKIQRLAVDAQGVRPPETMRTARVMYCTPSRQFPTGACLPVARRMALLAAAKRIKAWLLEDDYDSEFRYTRPPLPSLHSLDPLGRVIYLGSMSKVLCPSLRIGYVVLPEKLIQPFESLRSVVDDHGPLIDQATLAEFIVRGEFFTHIRRCRKVYSKRLTAFLECVDRHRLPLTFPFTDGGMNQTGYFDNPRVDDESVSRALASVGLDVPSLSRYSQRKTHAGLVFGFTAFDETVIRSAIDDVAQLMQKLERP